MLNKEQLENIDKEELMQNFAVLAERLVEDHMSPGMQEAYDYVSDYIDFTCDEEDYKERYQINEGMEF